MGSRLSLDLGQRDILARRGHVAGALRCTFALQRRQDGPFGDVRRSVAERVPQSVDRPETLSRIGACLDRLARRHADRIALRYERVVNRRRVRMAGEAPWRSTSRVWALTGALATGNSIEIPIGWSGRGDGLATLEQGALDRHLEWLAQRSEKAEPGEAGAVPTVLSAQAAAVLVHEAIGHFAEASPDPRIDLSHRLGCRLAAEDLVVLDDPGLGSGVASYKADDERVKVLGPTELVSGGVLRAQLHSRSSAARACALPTGNSRAALWSRPLPRMSNLICLAGSECLESLIHRVWRGLMIHQLAYGYGNGIQIGAQVLLAERIERGRLTGRFVSGMRVAERADLFLRATGVADRPEQNPNGMCGKAGQMLFDVGTSAPAIALSRLELRR